MFHKLCADFMDTNYEAKSILCEDIFEELWLGNDSFRFFFVIFLEENLNFWDNSIGPELLINVLFEIIGIEIIDSYIASRDIMCSFVV